MTFGVPLTVIGQEPWRPCGNHPDGAALKLSLRRREKPLEEKQA